MGGGLTLVACACDDTFGAESGPPRLKSPALAADGGDRDQMYRDAAINETNNHTSGLPT
jgi:hypothetical protein